ncbi:MAG: hypothetical protein ABI039_09755, partial [Vicinamibacterales bacterium]
KAVTDSPALCAQFAGVEGPPPATTREKIARLAGVSLFLFVGASTGPTFAQSPAPYIRAIANHLVIESLEVLDWKTRCPAGHIPLGYTIMRGHSYDEDELLQFDLTDSNGTVVDRNAVSSTDQIVGGGFAVSLNNTEHHLKDFEVLATCLALSASADNTVALVRATGTAAAGAVGSVNSFCGADFPVALAGFSNANNIQLQDVGTAPVWGTGANPLLLSNIADGQTGPPTGWQVKVFNPQRIEVGVTAYALCAKVPGLQTFVYSVPVAISFTASFSIFGAVPDGWTSVGTGFDTGSYAFRTAADVWLRDGTIANAQQWFPNTTYYDSGPAPVRAYMVKSTAAWKVGTPGGRAVLAVLAVPQSSPPPPPTSVEVVEFYNAGLDHYFITAFPAEINDLDTGRHAGWVRTGESFKAYGIGSSGSITRRPVCRAYGLPSQGLNTHFYSASPDECFATLSNLGAWGLEASEVLEMDLPDAVSGACPDAGVPVYRVWNRRQDSNHRYTTSVAIRDQMVQKGGVAEGYGPNAVALCALP